MVAGTESVKRDHGRWPANVLLGCACVVEHDEDCPVRMLGEQSGDLKAGGDAMAGGATRTVFGMKATRPWESYGDSGSAARFFYTAKASRAEREIGCYDLAPVTGAEAVNRKDGSAGMRNPRAGAGRTSSEVRNNHTTVKPLALMRYLVKLTKTPTGGVVLDPFMGSGTTGMAAVLEGRPFIGIDLEERHFEIAWRRIQGVAPLLVTES